MSFTGLGEFVSLGYPWVLPGYEGGLQEELYDAVYGFAASPDYGGKIFAQRFREQWTDQISFFERHGFVVQRRDPIYVLNLSLAKDYRVPSQIEIVCEVEFCWDDFHEISAPHMATQQLGMWKQYFPTVDFDFAVKATRDGKSVAYMGVAIRRETGFAEIIAVTVEPTAPDAIAPCLAAIVDELRARKCTFLGTKPISSETALETIVQFGFRNVSDELFLSKGI
jgi:hypothetical protein